MNYNLQGIEAFLEIIDKSSLTKAAEALHLTQSTISHRLKNLEDELGVKLVMRGKGMRSVTITQKGEEFVNIARKISMINQDLDIWKNSKVNLHLDIGSVDSLNTLLFPPLYKMLSESKEQISLKVCTHWSYEVYRLLLNQDIDVGFVLQEVHSKNILIEPIFTERMVIIQSKLGELPSRISAGDLNPELEIFLAWGSEFQTWHNYWFDPKSSPYNIVDTASLIYSFLVDSKRWSIVPISMARALSKANSIKIVELLQPPPDRVCYKITHRYPRPDRKESLKKFDQILEQFKNSDYFSEMTS
ncbi:LysR family transcriptional regulator [Fusibacter ferrireducens]|uniref:LysR family transcriptional regulator n=1 Tax=Fusibacter ferrireducens TaxID=2785058 RepID=A0ABR9ZWW0_9FIRM|nr:LysR family transcriptional regulator [Fusibacter ferrireducens]MBF4694441.1 LysR family transcriptional regulator [Fusibacter ferrireducens]